MSEKKSDDGSSEKMEKKTWFQRIRIIGWPESPSVPEKIFQPLVGEEFLAIPIKYIGSIKNSGRQLAEILKKLDCPETIDAAIDDISNKYFAGLTGKTGYIINTSIIMLRLDCKAPASSHWLRKYRSPLQPWWHFPEGSYEIIDESKDPDQADWGTGETRQMSEEEKAKIRKSGLENQPSPSNSQNNGSWGARSTNESRKQTPGVWGNRT